MVSPERLQTYPECGWHYATSWSAELNKGEKVGCAPAFSQPPTDRAVTHTPASLLLSDVPDLLLGCKPRASSHDPPSLCSVEYLITATRKGSHSHLETLSKDSLLNSWLIHSTNNHRQRCSLPSNGEGWDWEKKKTEALYSTLMGKTDCVPVSRGAFKKRRGMCLSPEVQLGGFLQPKGTRVVRGVDPTYFPLLFPPSPRQDKRKRHWSQWEARLLRLSQILWVRLRPQLPLTRTLTPAPFHTGEVCSVWWCGDHAPSEQESMRNKPLSAAASLVLPRRNTQANSKRKKIQKTHTFHLSFSEIVKWKVCCNLLKITRWENLQSIGMEGQAWQLREQGV